MPGGGKGFGAELLYPRGVSLLQALRPARAGFACAFSASAQPSELLLVNSLVALGWLFIVVTDVDKTSSSGWREVRAKLQKPPPKSLMLQPVLKENWNVISSKEISKGAAVLSAIAEGMGSTEVHSGQSSTRSVA